MSKTPQVESIPPADTDVDPGPLIWDELAAQWALVQAVQAEGVIVDEAP